MCDVNGGYGGCEFLCLMRGKQEKVCLEPDVIPTIKPTTNETAPAGTAVVPSITKKPIVPPKLDKGPDKPIIIPCIHTTRGCEDTKRKIRRLYYGSSNLKLILI